MTQKTRIYGLTRNNKKKIRNNKKKTRNNKKKTRNKISRKHNEKLFKKGGNNEDIVKCCICDDEVNINETLSPSGCKREHGKRAHRICNNCWWNPKTGFGNEKSQHKCPGCEKGLPLTKVKLEEPVVIDLTEDSDDD